MPSPNKPRVVSVKDKPVAEREPPGEKTHRFLFSHKPAGARR
ncbi:MAG: hypothetical protein V1787_01135 [Candidatus Micrarchaeota archaeon]